MKLKIKEGKHLVTSFHYTGKRDDVLIVNLVDRWTYKCFEQKGNHLIIKTENGNIDFTGEVAKLEFDHQEKDQVVFTIDLFLQRKIK
ncbi:MAG: hypothetical protein GY936_14290 [Ignavibacteriae bacterium]|nr:hypothetical protein [Ignavibacteriota bacterium]